VCNSSSEDNNSELCFFFQIQDTTPQRHKRQIVNDSASENSDYELGSMSRSKRYKYDSADEDSDYKPGSTSRSKRYETHELHTSRFSNTDQKASPCVRSSSRIRKPNKWYDSDWSTATTPNHLLKGQVKDGMPVTPETPKSEVTPRASVTPVSKRVCVSPNVSEY
jgi:hypothetical protein